MRDRLADMIDGFFGCDSAYFGIDKYELADHLIANGVIVPPCKVGDSLWNIHYNKPKEWKVVYIGFNGEEWHINVHWSDKDHFVTREVDGKHLDRIFFRTKEEAEQALKEREQV